MKKITKRDILFFFIGIATFFIFETVYNWEESKEAMRKGFENGYKAGQNTAK
ncbi:MAG: hypothetical protein P8O16_06330 [Algoriphagus sp.]|jgi:uncharacterized membrane protein YidH (DUF202 family)|uniref:hypothetical protein n=1 Tax=Algoriphagus sp. TaxID=1872435 RepID=UPI00261C53A6|nr:hypothetical protein [Algoriphagus sp.]MDG1276881.1 hypothetical protein [Algoriphagus sp.]